ncbi:MAG: divalent metal cation transporter [Limisphaerales bacterium]
MSAALYICSARLAGKNRVQGEARRSKRKPPTTADAPINAAILMIVLSEVILALQLPFAMIPLLHFASSREKMGQWRLGRFLLIAGWGSALIITAFDLYGLPDAVKQACHVVVGH